MLMARRDQRGRRSGSAPSRGGDGGAGAAGRLRAHARAREESVVNGRLAGGRDLAAAAAAIALLTLIYRWLHIANATTVALSYLLVVLVVAATSRLRVAVVTSCLAMLT